MENPNTQLSTKRLIIKTNKQKQPSKSFYSLRLYDSLFRTVDFSHGAGPPEPFVTPGFSVPDKLIKKRKRMEPIDSEVDLMMSKEKRPLIRYSDMKPAHHYTVEGLRESVDNELAVKRLQEKFSTKKKNMRVNSTLSGIEPAPGEAAGDKYPILKDKELIQRFLKVHLTNNQKGRIRQVLRDILRGTSVTILPDVINNKIHTILRSSQDLTDTDLRKIRVLFNMLKTATTTVSNKSSKASETLPELIEENSENVKAEVVKKKKKKKHKKVVAEDGEGKKEGDKKEKSKEGKVEAPVVPKQPKRYVVFVGNLPPEVSKEQVKCIFPEIYNYIVDVRLPPTHKKAAYAYVELSNNHSYEIALSKHHTMMNRRRINVLYTVQNYTKMSKAEVKGKRAKLAAMRRAGQLAGSAPLSRKRSARRARQRLAHLLTEKIVRETNYTS